MFVTTVPIRSWPSPGPASILISFPLVVSSEGSGSGSVDSHSHGLRRQVGVCSVVSCLSPSSLEPPQQELVASLLDIGAGC